MDKTDYTTSAFTVASTGNDKICIFCQEYVDKTYYTTSAFTVTSTGNDKICIFCQE